jgi:hypothetical protein
MVRGLRSQTINAAMGTFARLHMDIIIANMVCPGMGRKAVKTPIKTAIDTEWRFIWSRLGTRASVLAVLLLTFLLPRLSSEPTDEKFFLTLVLYLFNALCGHVLFENNDHYKGTPNFF